MLSSFWRRRDAVVVPDKKQIRVSFNEERCYKCNTYTNLQPLTQYGERLSFCTNCFTTVKLFEYITEEDYVNNIHTIKPLKDTLENFLKITDI